MRGNYRRRSTTSWVIWGTAFTVVTVLLAWKFQWLGTGTQNSIVESGQDSDSEKLIAKNTSKAGEKVDPLNAEVFNRQTEPGERDPNDFKIPNRFGTKVPQRRKGVQPWEATPDRTNNPANRVNQDPSVRQASATSNNPQGNFLTPKNQTTYNGKGGNNQYSGNQYDNNRTVRNSDYSPRIIPGNQGTGIVRTGNERPQTTVDSGPPAATFSRIDLLIQRKETLAAHKELSRIYWQKPAWRSAIRTRIEKTAQIIFFSDREHFITPHTVQPNEYLSTIAKQYNVTYQYLERLNRVKASRIQAGRKLKVLKGPFAAVVDLSDRELTVHFHGYYVTKFRVGIGRDKRSPIGKHKVLNKVVKPQYTGRDPRTLRNFVIAGDDPKNPLGTHWIDIGNSFGIHGTNAPNSIGKAASKGCIRMHNNDVSLVYDLLQSGSEIIIQE
jgi:lipoprotein-anchoring transpeptidase ErfK/SrfK